MKRRKISQIETEEALKWLLNIERPIERKNLSRLLTRIAKLHFVAGNNSSLCNTVLPKEITRIFLSLCENWRQDIAIALLLLDFLRKVLQSFWWGELVAVELCKPTPVNLNVTAISELFITDSSDVDLKISTCEVILALLEHGNSAEIMGQHARIRVRGDLLNLLSNHRNITQIGEVSLAAIYHLLRGSSRTEQQKFSVSSSIETIIAVCKEQCAGAAVVREAAKVFGLLIEADNQNPALLTDDVITIILHTMKRNAEDLEINKFACHAIANLCEDKNICETIEDNGGSVYVTKALRNFPQSQRLTLDCLCYIENVVGVSYEVANDASFLREVFDAMVAHADDARVQESACRAVSRLLENNVTAECKIGEDEGQFSIHACVVATMNIHIDDSYVFQAACSALHEMATASSRLQQLLVARGTYITIVDHMRAKKQSSEIQEWGFRALRALCLKNVLQEEILVKYELLTDIKETLHIYCDNAGVLQEVLGLLACLAADMEIVRRQCMLELIHDRVVEIMQANDNSVPLLKTCFETLAVFAASDEQSLLIGVLDSVEKAMRKFKFTSGLQVSGCILIQLLANDEFCDNEISCSNIVNLVCEAISNFPCDEEVQTEGIVTLKVIAETESGLRELLNQEAHQYMFNVMNSVSLLPDVLQIAAEGLLLLSNRQQDRDRILQWAIINDKFKEASWLLQNGADVNSGALEKNNLLIAAEMKNPKMVSFLLEHGASNVQEALKITRRQHNHRLTGILLRHIGLEKKSGVLAWGNLNITELKSEYFSPSLIGKPSADAMKLEGFCWEDHFERASESRQQRFSSFEASSIGRLDSINSENDKEDNGSINVRRSRPCSLTGAVLPFVNVDPRLEGPLDISERFVRLDSPVLSNSYPGHPDGCLIPDDACGSLLPSPDRETKVSNIPSFDRSLSVLASCNRLSLGESSDDSPLLKNKRDTISRKISAAELRSRLSSDAKQFIKYVDLSCNSLSRIDLFQSKITTGQSLFNGLVGLDLRFNKLKNLSPEVCLELKQVKKVHLEGNEFQEFPYAILTNKSIETLNLKKNNIVQLDQDKMTSTITLSNLDISDNKLTSFPSWIGELFPALRSLRLSGNKISKLPAKEVDLTQLNQLDMSHNEIESVPGQFLERCVSLRKLDLSHNCLISLPDQSQVTSHQLTHLKLSHNRLAERAPWYVPKYALHLQNLAVLDVSHNKIVEVPSPSMWASRGLQDLNFDHNRIRKLSLDRSVSQWSTVCRLSISNNKLEHLPREIGLMTSLAYLNISHNPIRVIPDELGKLKNVLSEFPLDGLSLELHPSVRRGTAREICTFLYSKMKHAVPYLRMKFMVVGREGRGKTTLLRTLQGIKQPQMNTVTVGIEVKSWTLPVPRKHWARAQSKKEPFILSTWDFAGQVDFYSTHQCFLSSRALYLVVYDASKGPEDLETLRSWLLNINASAPGASVILVGTHADKVETDDRQAYFRNLQSHITDFMKSPGFPLFRGSAIVCCTRKNSDMEALKAQILEWVAKLMFKDKAPLQQIVPMSYVQLEDLLKEEANRLSTTGQIPIISRRYLMKITQENDISLDKEELDQAVKFLHEAGVLLHYDDPLLKLEDCYFIHPEWLSQMMAQVVTVPEINPFVDREGVLERKNVPLLFRGERFPEAFIDNYLSILQKFEMIIPLGDEKFLLPSKLPERTLGFTKRVTKDSLLSDSLSRYYKFPYIPVALWSRLISRLMLFHSPLQDEDEEIPVAEYWRDGIFRFWSEKKYFVVCTSEAFPNTLEIVVPVSQGGYELLGYLVDHVDTLIEEWYPGLASADPTGHVIIKRLAPCIHCSALNKLHCFPLETCIAESYVSDSIWCPSHKDDVYLRDIAPDVLLADVDGKFLIHESELDQKEGEGAPLGGGSFGAVYQTRYKGLVNVAVKVFKAGENIVPHRYLRQEVNILRHLRHPSLVSMHGVCLRPSRCLVMELAHIGSLRKVLDNGNHLSRGMQHRIASQVCEGLAHLHKHDIVYRDMKPGNILIFSLSMGIFVNAKISDYGISQYVTPSGFSSRGGTLGYRAPEVVKGESLYNKEADIFSLGITLYELVTRGKKPFGESLCQYEVDAAVLAKSAIKPITSAGCPHWPDMEHIIAHSLHANPDHRPTAQAIFDWLSSADTLCLKQEVGVCKGQSVECMAINQTTDLGRENQELWIASGDSTGHSQISWLPLIKKERKVQGCTGMILRDERILCISAIMDNLILAGTKKGHIIVFDSESHKQLDKMAQLPDSVLCLKTYSDQKERLLLAGLANEQLAIFKEKQFRVGDSKPVAILDLSLHSDVKTDNLTAPKYPATCLEIYRRKCYVGCGSSIAVVDLKLTTLDYIMKNCGEEGKIINHVAILKYIWVTSKDCSIVRALNSSNGNLLGSFDCAQILSQRFPGISTWDCRVVSLYLRQDALWVGCGGGHVVIVEPNLNFKVLAVVSRHSSTVRCIIGASGTENGKPVSLVLTGGVGFRERSQPTETKDIDSGYVLVWDSELPLQCAYLKTVEKRRDDMFKTD